MPKKLAKTPQKIPFLFVLVPFRWKFEPKILGNDFEMAFAALYNFILKDFLKRFGL